MRELTELPDWRIGCIFTGKGHRRSGVARAAVAAALDAIKEAGGGLVEAYPNRSTVEPPSEAPTSTPAQRACSRNSIQARTKNR